jgi:DNA-binding LytR/AlgR family response regulator
MKAVIIEDEKLNVAELKHLLEEVAPDIDVIHSLPSIKTARRWMAENTEPDLYFMDIRLGDGLSFELFNQFSIQCPVIFCTAYEEYAIKAFKVNGVDYILKPVQKDDLERAIEKARKQVKGGNEMPSSLQQLVNHFMNPAAAPSKYKERFIINANGKLTPVETKDIAIFYKDTLTYIYLFNGDRLIYDYSTLDETELLLDPGLFFRANRQCIINIHSIQTIKPQLNLKLDVQLKAPLKIPVDVSREKATQFKKWIDR